MTRSHDATRIALLLYGMIVAGYPGCRQDDRTDPAAKAALGGRVLLPRDDGPHERSLLEWWYWAGHLRADGGRRFGFHLVFFEARPLGVPIRVTHFAVADLQEGRFRYRVERERRPATGPRTGIELAHGDLSARAVDGKHLLAGRVEDYRLNLELAETRPPALHHQNGHIAYAFGGHAYYYSRTRMEARGVLRVGGQDLPVSGSVWFDHQWGDMGRVFEQGRDWFGLQLDDGRDIMVFRMRVAGEERLRGGTQVPADGPAVRLSPDEIAIEPEGTWKSPHTGCVYPRRWRIRIQGEEFVLAPLLDDQEIPTSVPVYWEGLAEASGAAAGAAFIELNGYCR